MKTGGRLARNGTQKGGDAGKREMFHAVFHGKKQNVSERSLTFSKHRPPPKT